MADPRSADIVKGVPSDWAEYQRMVGEIAGLKMAYEILEGVSNLHEDDELD